MASGKPSAPQTTLAAVDIPAPGSAPIQGTFAFRAGDEIPPAWLEQHKEYLAELEEGGAPKATRRAPLSEAPNIAAEARGVGSPQP
jgi:hypothetical protein